MIRGPIHAQPCRPGVPTRAVACTGNIRAAKLSREDVATMRRWARTEGFGLAVPDQARALGALYPVVKESTIARLLVNDGFYDPTYDRTTRLPDAAPELRAPSPWVLWWFVTWLLVLRGRLGPGVAVPILNPTFYLDVASGV